MADLALELLRHGYGALPRLWHSVGEDADYARTRLLGRPAHVVRGEAGARLLYDENLIERQGAVPAPLSRVLFGKGAVHGLDGDEHRRRKAIFLDVVVPERVDDLGADVGRELARASRAWPARTSFSLFDELVRVYGVCVLRWAGVAVTRPEAAGVARLLARIVDGFGFDPVAYPRAVHARWSVDRWARRVVEEARSGDRDVPAGTMLEALVRGPAAELTPQVAAVELVNVVRPTVAVAWLGAFAAVHLARNPALGEALAPAHARAARWHFADEVRRTTPFAPALAGRAREARDWRGHHIAAGDLVVLDVPGTNGSAWTDPDVFRPGRFSERTPGPFDHVPQGGGDRRNGHRCPGEPIAMTLLDRTLFHLAGMSFTISAGDPDLRRIPTLPADGPSIVAVGVPAPGGG
jgi:fatty-acid peroxygenase